jgi:DNA-binding transcriptional MerR regulator
MSPAPSTDPIYNLAAVIKRTGLHADTLRAWERRYGIPMPQRTPGRQRLYSERDVQTIKWLVDRQAQGMTISRAAREWRRLEEAQQDPLAASEARSEPVPPREPIADGRRDVLRDRWISACLAFDESAAIQCAREAFALYSEETAILEVLLPALRKIGERWVDGQLSVQQEHFASVMLTRLIESLIAAAQAPTRPGRVLLACPAGELHGLPLEVLVLLLRRRGRDVIGLGTDVPLTNLDDTIAALQPALVVLSAQQLASAAVLKQTAEWLGRKGTPVGFGGRIFNLLPELQSQIAGTFIGETFLAAAEKVAAMLDHPPEAPRRPRTRGGSMAQAFREARKEIDSLAGRQFSGAASLEKQAVAASELVGRSVAAALELGNAEYLALEIDSIPAALRSHGMPSSSIRKYLEEYSRAMQRALGQEASVAAKILEARALRQTLDTE